MATTPSRTVKPPENKMGVQPVGRLLAGMAVPMMISMLVQALELLTTQTQESIF